MADGVVLRTLTLRPLVAGYHGPAAARWSASPVGSTPAPSVSTTGASPGTTSITDVIALRRRLLGTTSVTAYHCRLALASSWPDQLEDVSRDVLDVIIEGLSMYLRAGGRCALLDIAARLPGATVLIESCPACSRSDRERSEDAGAPADARCAAEFLDSGPNTRYPRRPLHPHHRALPPPARAPDAAATGGRTLQRRGTAGAGLKRRMRWSGAGRALEWGPVDPVWDYSALDGADLNLAGLALLALDRHEAWAVDRQGHPARRVFLPARDSLRVGGRNPVPDGVECPRPEGAHPAAWNVPGRDEIPRLIAVRLKPRPTPCPTVLLYSESRPCHRDRLSDLQR